MRRIVLAWDRRLTAMLAVVLLATGCADPSVPSREDRQRFVFSEGDLAPLGRVLRRAREGEAITIGLLGGSITEGARASRPERSWAGRLERWWKHSFPRCRLTLVNAGIGATGSLLGAHRVRADLLVHDPDLVIVEFAVNDFRDILYSATLEGTLRQILKWRSHPAVLLLFMTRCDGRTAQNYHAEVGRHYRLPMVSYHDVMWPLVRKGRVSWSSLSDDIVHPNDHGHAICADLLTDFLRDVTRQDWPAESTPPQLPPPLVSDEFEFTRILRADECMPARADGWSLRENAWTSESPGSSLEVEFAGTAVSVAYLRRPSGKAGKATLSVNGGADVEADAFDSHLLGDFPTYLLVARELPPRTNRLEVGLQTGHHPESDGPRFDVLSVLVAGTNLSARGRQE